MTKRSKNDDVAFIFLLLIVLISCKRKKFSPSFIGGRSHLAVSIIRRKMRFEVLEIYVEKLETYVEKIRLCLAMEEGLGLTLLVRCNSTHEE